MHTLEQLKAGKLKGITSIKLSAGLTELPAELLQLVDTLEILDLSGNKLTDLPKDITLFKKLRILFLSNNNFTGFPDVLENCTALDIIGFKANQIQAIPENAIPVSLRWLILTDNRIEALPESIGRCTKLQKVMLAGNRLQALPDSMQACKNIELLRISANDIHVLPAWLLTLPRLSWLAYANNPCSVLTQQEHVTLLPQLSWESFIFEEQLGAGASGDIFKAYLKDEKAPVAIKIFKGAVTSDGLPYDEMQACIKAGKHENLVNVQGELIGHPDGKPGLIMELIDADYKNLGGPPNFVTCTRDTFTTEQAFSPDAILSIARGIASVADQLHANGVMHGDLYAHNTLINSHFHPLLGDFGAATVYSRGAKVHTGILLERIEVRAFGCLLDDLLSRADQSVEAMYALEDLRDSCLNANTESRPCFKEIKKALQAITV